MSKNVTYGRRNSSYLLSDLKNFNEIFSKKSLNHGFTLSVVLENATLEKPQGGHIEPAPVFLELKSFTLFLNILHYSLHSEN